MTGGNIATKFIHFTNITVKKTTDNSTTCRDKKFTQVFKKGFTFKRVGGSINTKEVNLTTGEIN